MRYEKTLSYQKANGLIPYEETEQMRVVEFLRVKKIAHIHVANERIASVAFRKKLKALGSYAGFPDLMIFLPSKVLFIEMKRKAFGKVSKAQKEWIDELNLYPYAKAKVCYGGDEAIDFIKSEL